MASKLKLKQQLQHNLLAIISLVIAVSALTYTSWRNEQSEENRNFRSAGFEIMKESARLQYLIDSITYISSEGEVKNNEEPIIGWVTVNHIVSLSQLMMPEIKDEADELKQVWTEHWDKLSNDQNANKRITEANTQLSNRVRSHLISLH